MFRSVNQRRRTIRKRTHEFKSLELSSKRVRKIIKNTFKVELSIIVLGIILGVAGLIIAPGAIASANDYLGTNTDDAYEWGTYVYSTEVEDIYRMRILLPEPQDTWRYFPLINRGDMDIKYMLTGVRIGHNYGDWGIYTRNAPKADYDWSNSMSAFASDINDIEANSEDFLVWDARYKADEAIPDSSDTSWLDYGSSYLISSSIDASNMIGEELTKSADKREYFDLYFIPPKFELSDDNVAERGYLPIDDSISKNDMYDWTIVFLWGFVDANYQLDWNGHYDNMFSNYLDPYEDDETAMRLTAGPILTYTPTDNEIQWEFSEEVTGTQEVRFDITTPEWVPDWYWKYWRGATPSQSWYPKHLWGYSTEFFVDALLLPEYLSYIFKEVLKEAIDPSNIIDLVFGGVMGLLGDDSKLKENDLLNAIGLLFQLVMKFFIDGLAVVLSVIVFAILLAMVPLFLTLIYQISYWVQVFPPLGPILALTVILGLDFIGVISLVDIFPFLKDTFLKDFGGTP